MRTFLVLVIFLSVDCTVNGDCPEPTPGPHMILVSDHTFPVAEGTTATFGCEIGYRKVGKNGNVVCTNGQWTSIPMTCEIKSCGSTDEVLNGRVDFSQGTDFGATARLICNDGYSPLGSETIYCGANSQWEGRLGECEPIVCDPPNPITNGYFIPAKDEYQYFEVITYKCNGEYVVNGSSSSTCENERFMPAPPTCVLVNCPDPKVENGVAAGGARPPYKFQNSVTFSCNRGYNMQGLDTVSCNINSKWSPDFPKCIPVECKAPEIKDGELVDGSRPSYKFSETITVKCSEGFYLNGQSTLTCGEGNQWSPAEPVCTLSECKAPEISNGEVVGGSGVTYKYKETITVKCSEDYKLTGQSTLTCGERNQWTSDVPVCTLIKCQTPQVPGGELVQGASPTYKYKDIVKFKCKLGHNLSGEDTLMCDANGQWSPKLPQCTPVVCKTPEVKDGQVVKGSQSSYKYDEKVVFECKNGYTMNGQSTLTCGRNSQWSPELPQCTRNNGNGGTVAGIVLGVSIIIQLFLHKLW